MRHADPPEVSIVIPIHNEEAILARAVEELRKTLGALGRRYEIILAENGSTDRTVEIALELALMIPEVRWFSSEGANYGRALRLGLRAARGELVLCDEIDLCDESFHRAALELIDQDQADLVIGSKLLAGSFDRRPRFRHVASLVYSTLLRLLFGFRGTDTHGPKALRRSRLRAVIDACVVERDVFASELVIRAERAELRVREIPLDVREKRPPSIHLLRRVPQVIRALWRLGVGLRKSGPKKSASPLKVREARGEDVTVTASRSEENPF